MTAGANRPAATDIDLMNFDEPLEVPRPYAFSVAIRTKVGDDLEGLEASGDGISFRSPEPLQGGQVIELVICHALLVEAKVVGCTLMPGETDSYWVRARFHETSPALNELICKELNRIGAMIG